MALHDPAPAMSVTADAPAAGGARVALASRWRGLSGTRLFGLGALLLLIGALAWGVWTHYTQHSQAIFEAQKRRSFIPSVRVETVRESDNVIRSTWPGTNLGFEQANIYARATGYISTRNVDIGSKVRAGDVLAVIAAPDLDKQLTQARGQLVQMQAAVEQARSTAELGRVTTSRSSKLASMDSVSRQQADNDRLTYASEKAAVSVAQANVVAQQAAVDRLMQLTGFEKVTAPFDGTVSARFVDVGSLVQADTASGTSLFTMIHSNVIRVQTYVPQDQAYGLTAGVEALVRVPEMPKRGFPGKVTRVAGALAPGTRTLLAEIDVPNPDNVSDGRNLLHRRAEDSAQDAFADRPCRRRHFQPERLVGCGCRKRRSPYAQDHHPEGFRQGGRGFRGREGGRPSHHQSPRRSPGGRQGGDTDAAARGVAIRRVVA